MRMKPSIHIFTVLLTVFALSGCAQTQLFSHYAKKVTWPGQEKSKGVYKVGNPYQINGVWYYPQETFEMSETGIASWYGPGFHGKLTANGEVYDQMELTAAHRTLQMPSLVRVTNLENGRSIVVRINDRGPFAHGRIIDLSKRGAQLLGFDRQGTARVRVDVLKKESMQLAAAAKAGQDTSRMDVAQLSKQPASAALASASSSSAIAMAPPVQSSYSSPQQLATMGAADNDLPESLQIPTITVEELAAPAAMASRTAPATPPQPTPMAAAPAPVAPVQGHLNDGRFMPDPVVATAPVRPTGIFVQAGSFSVQENALRLSERLNAIAPAKIEEVAVQGRTFYRVKLGPIANVEEADLILQRVIESGQDAARVIKH